MALPVRRADPDAARWDPFDQIQRLSTRLQSLLSSWDVPDLAGAFTPLADVEETDDAYLLELELPGDVEEDQVTASMDAGVLSVRVPKPANQRRRRIPVA